MGNLPVPPNAMQRPVPKNEDGNNIDMPLILISFFFLHSRTKNHIKSSCHIVTYRQMKRTPFRVFSTLFFQQKKKELIQVHFHHHQSAGYSNRYWKLGSIFVYNFC